ncbi:MAG: transposase [Mediterranea sp.]|jgi:REP element-mobilizing transposase RayT|nr:transposase [Mediterranea sp.]
MKIHAAYQTYAAYFLDPAIQTNIRDGKEEQFQEAFLRELFVKVLGYTLNPSPNYNLITERKHVTDAQKADGAILVDGAVKAVIELKDHKITDLKQIEAQAFGYKNNNLNTPYVITSNFEKLRFYIDNSIDYEEFHLFNLSEDDFATMWLCLAYDNLSIDLPKRLKAESTRTEEHITKQLYKDYSAFKRALFEDLTKNNPTVDKLLLFRKTQKALDRLLFAFFAEDKGLLPPNSMQRIIEQWEERNADPLHKYQPLYSRLALYFHYIDIGHKGKKEDIFGYNGGLFQTDDVLDSLLFSDHILKDNILKLSSYNYDTEVNINILEHILENNLKEIEKITAQTARGFIPLPKTTATTISTSTPQKDRLFPPLRHIPTHIIENTLGKLCADKKAKLNLIDTDFFIDKDRTKKQKQHLLDILNTYREWLLSLTICDPACGSGVFLNAALDFLMKEHHYIDELNTKIFDSSIVFPHIENTILENNLYGVGLNEESVEIAKLTLWLRTAQPHRKLNSLNNNIKCGISLIAGDKAFDWHKEFPLVFKPKNKKAFHIVTAIHDSRTSQRMIKHKVREKRFNGTLPEPQVHPLSGEDELIITQTIADIVKEDKLNVLAYNICRDHLHLLLVCEEEEIVDIVKKIKGRSSRAYHQVKGMNPLVKNEGERSISLWTQKYGCIEIRSDEHLQNAIEYIRNNRVKHGMDHSKGIHPLANPTDNADIDNNRLNKNKSGELCGCGCGGGCGRSKGMNPLAAVISDMTCDYDYAFREEYKGGFDVVIGNPPYVRFEHIEKSKVTATSSETPARPPVP